MPKGFQKDNKLAAARKVYAGGRPTKEQAAEKNAFLDAVRRERDRRAGRLATRYLDMAEADPATMRHLVDKDWAPAKQQVEHLGSVIVHVKSSLDWDKV